MTTRTRKGKAPVWGFFFYSTIEKRRVLHTEPTKEMAEDIHAAEWYGTERGPIFRITEPAKPRSRKT
jgi:hypothetical protein